MCDFTKREIELIQDNLQSFIANFGKPRIERGEFGGFYVFTDNSDSWRQYCYNIDYLNGWLYGCVQAVWGDPKVDKEAREMMANAGFRERYAVMHGERDRNGYNKSIVFFLLRRENNINKWICQENPRDTTR